MKKIFSLLVIFSLLILLSGCKWNSKATIRKVEKKLEEKYNESFRNKIIYYDCVRKEIRIMNNKNGNRISIDPEVADDVVRMIFEKIGPDLEKIVGEDGAIGVCIGNPNDDYVAIPLDFLLKD